MLHCNSHSQPGPQTHHQQQQQQQKQEQQQSDHLVTVVTVVNSSSSGGSSRNRSAMSPKGDRHQQQQQSPHTQHHHHQHRNGQNGQPLLQRPVARLQSEDDPFIRDTDSPPPPDLHVEPDVLLHPHRDDCQDSVLVPGSDPLLSGHHPLSHHVQHHHSHHRHHHHHHHHHPLHHQQEHEERSHSRLPNHRQSGVRVSSQSPAELMQQQPRISSSRRSLGPERLSSLSQDQLALHYQKLHVSQRTMSGSVPVKSKSPTGQEVVVPSDEGNGTWSKLPLPLLERIFSYLSLSQVYQCSLTCVSWSQILRHESSPVWERLCRERIPASILKSDLLSSIRSAKGRLRALAHAWNPADCSRNVYIKSNGLTLHRNPVAQSTDAARARIGYTRGRHCWEVWWEGPLGTVSMVGVCTKDQVMQASGYVPLLGSAGGQSWGWNLVDNSLVHDGEVLGSFPLHNNAPKYQTGERIRLLLDCDRHTLSFEKNYEFLGVAFVGLPTPRTRLFPAVSAVYGNTEVSILYLGLPLDG